MTSPFALLPAIDSPSPVVGYTSDFDETAFSATPSQWRLGRGGGAAWLHVVIWMGALRDARPHEDHGRAAAVGGPVRGRGWPQDRRRGSSSPRVRGSARGCWHGGTPRPVVRGRTDREHGRKRGRQSCPRWSCRWQRLGASSTGPDALEAIGLLADQGVTTFEVTAIDRDGLLDGPDLGLLDGPSRQPGSHHRFGWHRVGSGTAGRAIGCAGAIIGRALMRSASLWMRVACCRTGFEAENR